ncbi:hypothetical protein N0V82_000470 [Gnomoniopsis sp. IMI 355080]|nr:hypothetical protein N0V82_000470 [Gnomoniopsis sp. IMI 355080]
MVFGFFKIKRSAHSKKNGIATVEAGPPASHDRPSPFPNPLALNPPNRLHFIPEPKGQQETARLISGDLSATADLSHLISCADRLSKLAPELNMGGLVATQRLLKTGGADASELLADQARAEERLKARHNRTLPRVHLKVSIKSNSVTSKFTEDLPVNTSCDACRACFEQCSACYHAAETGSPPRSRNPSPEKLARLDKRPVPMGYDLASPASICSSVEDLHNHASLNSAECEDEDEGEICQVTTCQLGVVQKGAKIINIGSASSKCCSTVVRLAVPFDSPRYYSLPYADLARPDSPTLPAEFPAPLFSKRK